MTVSTISPITFGERDSWNGKRVRVVVPYRDSPHLTGLAGVVVPRQRLPWVDSEERPFKTLSVLMDEPIGCSTNVAIIGVDHLELI